MYITHSWTIISSVIERINIGSRLTNYNILNENDNQKLQNVKDINNIQK